MIKRKQIGVKPWEMIMVGTVVVLLVFMFYVKMNSTPDEKPRAEEQKTSPAPPSLFSQRVKELIEAKESFDFTPAERNLYNGIFRDLCQKSWNGELPSINRTVLGINVEGTDDDILMGFVYKSNIPENKKKDYIPGLTAGVYLKAAKARGVQFKIEKVGDIDYITYDDSKVVYLTDDPDQRRDPIFRDDKRLSMDEFQNRIYKVFDDLAQTPFLMNIGLEGQLDIVCRSNTT